MSDPPHPSEPGRRDAGVEPWFGREDKDPGGLWSFLPRSVLAEAMPGTWGKEMNEV